MSFRFTIALALAATLPAPLSAQSAADAYLDPGARELVAHARAAREEAGRDITSYTAVVRRRAAVMLRLPLKDRLLGREESAARIHWSRDGESVVQLLAGHEQAVGETGAVTGFDTSMLFDPTADRIRFAMSFGNDDDGDRRDRRRDGERAEPDSAATAPTDSIDEDSDVDVWIAHPLADDAESHYRYASGDTLTLRLADGSVLRTIQLRVIPREASWHYVDANLWIDAKTGSVVQASYRPARNLDIERDEAIIDPDDRDVLRWVPGMFKPLQADLDLVTIEFSLWDMQYWLPRRMRIDGWIRAGVVRLPFSGDMSYTIEDVRADGGVDSLTTAVVIAMRDLPDDATAADTAAAIAADSAARAVFAARADSAIADWPDSTALIGHTVGGNGGLVRVYVPKDTTELLKSEYLPPPVWEDAPGFASSDELESLADQLRKAVPRSAVAAPAHVDFAWGLGGHRLLRYNRVEGLSVGARATVVKGGASVAATARLGTADLHPGAFVDAELATDSRTLFASVYHRLTTVETGDPALGLGNSVNALLFGRDDGQYYRATGVSLGTSPRPADRQWYRVELFAERDEAVERETKWSVARVFDDGNDFRPVIPADRADLAGARLTLSPWWGRDPTGVQGGLELYTDGATGDFDFGRARLTGRLALPLFSGLRAGLEAAAGTSTGTLPLQYDWFLGGPRSLRGYDGGSIAGPDFGRARVELAHSDDGAASAFVLFGDAGWAGRFEDYAERDLRYSAGVGVTLLDGLVRADLARALRDPKGWRFDLYLDALL